MVLSNSDIGELFSQMQASYGHQWAHKADAMPLWRRALGGFNRNDILVAVEKSLKVHPDFPPSLGQFAGLVEYNTPMLEGPDSNHDDIAKADRIYAYTMPADQRKNPEGNPHHIRLSNSVASRRVGESVDDYEKRMTSEITLAMYPRLRSQFQR